MGWPGNFPYGWHCQKSKKFSLLCFEILKIFAAALKNVWRLRRHKKVH